MPTSTEQEEALRQLIDRYLGQWSRLVSTTNWEKGRIIAQWRDAMIASGHSAREYSDEAWSQRVHNVSSQHTGRLRRVFDQFGQTYRNYEGLYWSHFAAALDWEDADFWLQGASQNSWSISAMRRKRWESLGLSEEEEPTENERELESEYDEDSSQPGSDDFYSDSLEEEDSDYPPEGAGESFDTAAPWEDEDGPSPEEQAILDGAGEAVEQESPPPSQVRPFESLPDLPEDLAEAFDQFKLAILRHKVNRWQDVACDDILATLDALKQMILASNE
ncbi:Hypothetical protein PBC10988_21110 [Planctomycetales bacterium 10988]|nr:Hypothetical protein PBC10988_21110 [Planctomycetales bacterium 10988]